VKASFVLAILFVRAKNRRTKKIMIPKTPQTEPHKEMKISSQSSQNIKQTK